jgi:type II secretion system protein G
MRSREKGFTLLELLVVVAIIAIIAGIAIVGYRMAMDRSRQKKTMNDMRMIATAWEARATDAHTYTVAGYTFPAQVAPADLLAALTPTYIRQFPVNDGWGNAFGFGAGTLPKDYAIRSPGRDGVLDGNNYAGGEFDDIDCDIVFAGGTFVQYPGK